MGGEFPNPPPPPILRAVPLWFDFQMPLNLSWENKTSNDTSIKLNSERFCYKNSFKIIQMCDRYPSMVCLCPCGAELCIFRKKLDNCLRMPCIGLALRSFARVRFHHNVYHSVFGVSVPLEVADDRDSSHLLSESNFISEF